MTVRPATVADLVAHVRAAHAARRALRLAGGGAWLDAGHPVRADAERVDLSALTGIVEYVPGDLTMTVRAGTSLAELDAATAAHGQWCPLLPWGSDDGTVGATFATATTGPLRRSLGAPRDLALGLEFVDGTGALVRAGGRVVKNVAGFDLTRLLVGSWGTLGAITEISVRLRARPAIDESWAVVLDGEAARDRANAFRRGPLAPLSFEPLTDASANALGLAARHAIVRIGGNASFVAASRSALRALGDVAPCEPAIWNRYRAFGPGPRALPANALTQPVAQRVKHQFDPHHILNPGILGEPSA